ncbi:helix-turn-helix transcriptional regulator [Aestuariicella hydrocarbonica]|uniref:Helix-turn-helix transcriptional regulator n=1 Tax=Pseudomaricurvus hydrocarbonicus TaxID=1470433 RepID=A0A9E5T1H8_9GAMM|nr:helix-turn-helix transcriptional regulator [Aestuariicella hydrocarbonica]NHO67455.1 helix-turn-helix transcriptional regulator [Aestuariicella hydrocarbonica]
MVKSAKPEDLLLALLNGPFESPLWSTFLDGLRQRTRADYSSLVFRPPGLPENTVFHLFSGNLCPPVIQQLYRDSFYKQDPTPYHDMQEGRVYTLKELLQNDNPAHEAYLNAIMFPSGMNCARMVRVEEPGGVSAWLTITRSQRDFSAADGKLLSDLVPYLRSVLRSYMALEQERTNALLAGDAIRRLSYGWITLDACGHILETNEHGRDMLENTGPLRRDEQGGLKGASMQQSREILDAVRQLATTDKAKPSAIIVSRDPWLDMLLVPASRKAISAKAVPAVVAYIHGDSSLSADRREQLRQLFGLSPSEARLALALGRGMSISEAAGELNLTVESARTYSKKVYAKMGARGQTDLVLFIQRSVLQIA